MPLHSTGGWAPEVTATLRQHPRQSERTLLGLGWLERQDLGLRDSPALAHLNHREKTLCSPCHCLA